VGKWIFPLWEVKDLPYTDAMAIRDEVMKIIKTQLEYITVS
jgi:hypothetical protein